MSLYTQVALGEMGSTQWNTKTFNEIRIDLMEARSKLFNQALSQDTNFDFQKNDLFLKIAEGSIDWLSTTNEDGISVRQWLIENYPYLKIISCKVFNRAYQQENIFTIHIDTLDVQKYPWAIVRFVGI